MIIGLFYIWLLFLFPFLLTIWLMWFSKALVPDKEMTAPLRQLQNSTEASPICLSLIEILNSSESLITLVNVALDFDDFTSQVVVEA